ncbi:MAG: LPS export ABC transporter periplasmic protein LptC [Elusimicrobia bacterium]|nr:LPS export ABC transporter periplasmic protein LptC [Elusimicrobiota bacterium]
MLISCDVNENIDDTASAAKNEQTIEKFVITETKDGKIKTILESDFAVINDDEKIAVLTEPKVKFYEDGKYQSYLVADKGEVDMNTNNIKALGNCVVDTVNGEHLETTDVTYDANTKMIFSDSDIKITRDNDVIYGKGFESDTDLQNIVIKQERIIID